MTKIVIGLYNKNFEKPEDFEKRKKNVKAFLRGRVDAGFGRVSDGYWKGSREKAYVFECVDMEDYLVAHGTVEGLVEDLCKRFDQESIPVIRDGEIEFVEGVE